MLVAILLPLLIYKFIYFRQLKTAAWANLIAALSFGATTCNTFIGLQTWQFTKFTGIPAANTPAYIGLALSMMFSFLMIIFGSIMEHSQGHAGLGGLDGETQTRAGVLAPFKRTISNATKALFTSVDLSRKAFFACMALAFIGWVLTLAGLASLQSYCSNQPEEMAKYKLSLVYYPIGGKYMDCSSVFSGQWWAWTLMTVTLLAVCLLVKYDKLGKFKAATWALIISSVTFNIFWIDIILEWIVETDGTLLSRIQTLCAGYMIFDIAGFGLLFTGSAYIYANSSIGQQSMRREKSDAALMTKIFNVLQVLSVAALILTLVGVALYQDAMMGKVESQYVFSLRFTWFTWAISFVANVSLAIVWYSSNPKIKSLTSVVWLLFMYATVISMVINSYFYAALDDYKGSTLTRAKVALAGFVIWDAIAYLIIFAGCAAAWEMNHADDDATDSGPGGDASAASAASALEKSVDGERDD